MKSPPAASESESPKTQNNNS